MLYRRTGNLYRPAGQLDGAFWTNLLNTGTGYFAASEARSLARTAAIQDRRLTTAAGAQRPGWSTPMLLGVVAAAGVLLFLAFRK